MRLLIHLVERDVDNASEIGATCAAHPRPPPPAAHGAEAPRCCCAAAFADYLTVLVVTGFSTMADGFSVFGQIITPALVGRTAWYMTYALFYLSVASRRAALLAA